MSKWFTRCDIQRLPNIKEKAHNLALQSNQIVNNKARLRFDTRRTRAPKTASNSLKNIWYKQNSEIMWRYCRGITNH